MAYMENLTFKNLTTINAIVIMLTGLDFLLAPKLILDIFDVEGADSDQMQGLGRLLGMAIVTLSIVLWSIRNMEVSDLRKNLTIAFFVQNVLAFILTVMLQLDDIVNALHWPVVFIYFLFALGYGYFLIMKPEEAVA